MALDEWKTGLFKKLKFTTELYEPVYQEHMANLKALSEADPEFLVGLGEEISEDCM